MLKVQGIKAEGLRWICDPGQFTFESTEDIPPLEETIGQERALRAIDFGLGLESHGFNIYVLGESGTGKLSTVKSLLEKRSKDERVPDDWCYVYNFLDPDRPRALNLPPGTGGELKRDMGELVESLKREIPKVFESKDYERHRDEIFEGQQERTKALFYRLEQRAAERGFALKKTVSGLTIVPEREGKVLSEDDIERLPKEERERIAEDSRILQERLSDSIREARNVEKETKERVNALDREVVQYVVNPFINELLEKYKDFPRVTEYLNEVREDVLERSEDFRPKEEFPLPLPGMKFMKVEPTFERYDVNLIVNNRDTKGAPVVIETNPTYYNLFGRIEHRVQYGVAITDFTMIKAGSLHRANGGYLVVNALDILRNIFSYDALKRAIKNREVRIEDVWEQYRLMSTITLKPEAIPLDVKVILVGIPFLYYLLYNLDDEYRKLFKVKADFDTRMPRTRESMERYASFIAARCKEEGLRHFDRTGVARVVEHGCRLAEDQERLTARFSEITDLIREASFWAGDNGNNHVTGGDVEKAIREKVYRNSRLEDRLRDLILEGTLMVDTDGDVIGQVNGISILDLGDYSFGKPSRITARTYLGEAGVVNIEREVKMSGRIHNKAHMILTSYLGERYARRVPLALSASICFEQSYEEVEGDSATCTEVYALLSSLSGLPLKQGIAVTGSMNQKGEVQPVGGINEKIEGFFDVCSTRGLAGSQGVVIPERNLRNLMLRGDLVEAVAAGKFHIYPIRTVEEGMEVLTGIEAGERLADGSYPEGTVNCMVEKRLFDLATAMKEFGKAKPKGEQPS
jgi:lon-related putative ATP-dependent protease